MEIKAKAFGKILIFGAYSILEPGNIGLVVNIDKGTTSTVIETSSGKIVIDLSNFKVIVQGVMENNRLKLKKETELFKFIKNAVDYSFRYLHYKACKIKDIRLVSYNDPELYVTKELKTGFGSSATSTVSAVAAILSLHGIEDREAVHRISMYAHYKSQGNIGSGFDITAACFGSHFFISQALIPDEDFIKFVESKKDIIRKSYDWNTTLLPVIIFTGNSASTTELVKKVLDFKQKNINSYRKFMEEYNSINMSLKDAFESNEISKIKLNLERSWGKRKELGKISGAEIEPEKYTKLIKEINTKGAFTAGLIGAGGGDSILALCKSKTDKKKLVEFCESKKMVVFDELNLVNKSYEFQSQ
jgi:phosphomevalonate kinase